MKSKCIDRAFELIQEQVKIEAQKKDTNIYSPFDKDLFAKYDHEKQEWEVVDIYEEIRKLYMGNK